MRYTKKAFTLIELLVVIAIIALLLAVIMPALNKAKDIAKMVVCLSNHKTLVMAWKAYSADNNGEIVDGHTLRGGTVEDSLRHWVEPPISYTAAGKSKNESQSQPGNQTLKEHELNGIRAGTLYPYVENVDVYRCPAERRGKQGIGVLSSFRTYSIPAPMNGEYPSHYDERGHNIRVTKDSQIKNSAAKFVFIDDFDPRSWNMGSWIFGFQANGAHTFSDPIGVFHFKKCNFSFADGHANAYVWKDRRTHKASRYRALGEGVSADANPGTALDNEDLRFLGRGYKPR